MLGPGPTVDELHALVLAVAARKLGVYGGFSREDVEDAASEAMVRLIERLGAGPSGDAGAPPIDNLEGYAATVTYNCCAHLIRQRHPERARLKSRIRYVLGGDPRFAIWDEPIAGAVCGRAAWRATPAGDAAHRTLDAIGEAPDRVWPGGRVPGAATPAGLAGTLDAIFAAVDGPVELDRLVAVVVRLTGLGPAAAAPDEAGAAPAGSVVEHREARIDDRRVLARLWAEIGDLPLRQRLALLLSLRDHAGAGVLWLLPIVGLASIRQIAGVLDIPAVEMAAIWPRLPLDDLAIAERLACTRQQVINLRMAGRKRLATRLRAARRGERATPRGNLTVVSPSMEHET